MLRKETHGDTVSVNFMMFCVVKLRKNSKAFT